ncbi:MAG TPA: hypothetical protein VMD59_19945, partial [Acidimicrobiales bacterium]|nr:hypothetical protein [Acidimicrobiales bacterium]
MIVPLAVTLEGLGAPGSSASSTAPTISTLAGGSEPGLSSATGIAIAPYSVATATLSGVSWVYVADSASGVVRRIDAATGQQTVVAGDGEIGYAGNGGSAAAAELDDPSGIAADSAGDLWIADEGNAVVRFVPGSSGTYYGQTMTAGDIYTIAGGGSDPSGCSGHSDSYGDGCAATQARLSGAFQIAVDSSKNVYIADSNDNEVRAVPDATTTLFGSASLAAGDIYAVAGNGTASATPCDACSATNDAVLSDPTGAG